MTEANGYVDGEAVARELDMIADRLEDIQSTLCDENVKAKRARSRPNGVDWSQVRQRLDQRKTVY